MTLEEAKNYLRIDDNFDDVYIESLIDTTQIYIDSCVGEAYKSNDKLVNDLYDSKSSHIQNNMVRDRIVETIFMKLANEV